MSTVVDAAQYRQHKQYLHQTDELHNFIFCVDSTDEITPHIGGHVMERPSASIPLKWV